MSRFLLRPRWIAFHLVVVVGIVVMVNLGFWQLDRLAERRDFNDRVLERTEQSPLPLGTLLADPGISPDAAEWSPVVVTGTYLPEQIVEFNQSQNGRAGENVLSALVTDDGTTVVVNRGFIALGTDVPPAPTGPVEVLGLVRTSEERSRGELTDDTAGPITEVRRVDLPLIAAQLPGEVAPVYLQLVDSDPPATSTDPAPVVRPELGDGPHLSYAVQWFIFAACVAIGWVLAVRRSASRRRRGVESRPEMPDPDEPADERPAAAPVRATAAPAGAAGPPPPGDDGAPRAPSGTTSS